MPVERVSSFKLLGLLLSDDLSWNCHVDYVIKKANTRLYALRILKKAGLSQSELVNIYCSFIRSIIEYASPACSSLKVYLSGVNESIQKRALRIIYPDTSYEGALICTGLETLSTRRDNSCIKYITKLKSEDVDYNHWHVLLGENLSILNTIIILEHNQLTNVPPTLTALEIS